MCACHNPSLERPEPGTLGRMDPIAEAAFVVALVSLGWQVWTHMLGGPVLSVELDVAMSGAGGAFTLPRNDGRLTDWMSHYGDMGYHPELLVTLRNRGRMTGTVPALRLIVTGGFAASLLDVQASAQVGANDQTSVHVRWDILATLAATWAVRPPPGGGREVWVEATLGGTHKRRASNRLSVVEIFSPGPNPGPLTPVRH